MRLPLYSRTFKTMEFNYNKIASNEKHAQPELLYGKNWQQVIEAKFQRRLQAYFQNTKPYQHLFNPSLRRFLTGFGFRFNPSKRIFFRKFNLEKKASALNLPQKSMMQLHATAGRSAC
ncbi:MAG: hypothetical protein H7A42_01935 [Chlamydiales bacterium]|nr:hypothetical protein [Chlamydiales bacterium]